MLQSLGPYLAISVSRPLEALLLGTTRVMRKKEHCEAGSHCKLHRGVFSSQRAGEPMGSGKGVGMEERGQAAEARQVLSSPFMRKAIAVPSLSLVLRGTASPTEEDRPSITGAHAAAVLWKNRQAALKE